MPMPRRCGGEEAGPIAGLLGPRCLAITSSLRTKRWLCSTIWPRRGSQVLQGGGRGGDEEMGRVAVVFEHATPNFVARQAFGLVKGFMYFLEIDEDAEDRMDVN